MPGKTMVRIKCCVFALNAFALLVFEGQVVDTKGDCMLTASSSLVLR